MDEKDGEVDGVEVRHGRGPAGAQRPREPKEPVLPGDISETGQIMVTSQIMVKNGTGEAQPAHSDHDSPESQSCRGAMVRLVK